jgi:2-phospho-L-lactate guanylyltransferase (CobY/MobA/RfbA family)
LDGTNVLARPCAVSLPAAYGRGSYRAHLARALESGRPVTVRRDVRLALDLDTVDDLAHPLLHHFAAEVLGR